MASLYIHIPFCKSRCIYCDFYSTTNIDLQTAYTQQLCNEIDIRKEYLGTNQLDTIYIGGGTPSILTTDNLKQIINKINSIFVLAPNYEFTIEANPGDISIDILRKWHSFGINRLSIGVQTFDNKLLKFLNRRHNSSQAQEAVKLAQKSGFKNISIDLIYGIPNQSNAMVNNDLATAINLNVSHISTYCLTYEHGTQLFKQWQQDAIKPLEDDTLNLMYDKILDILTKNNFTHYEVSNFCKSDMYSRHNNAYWIGEPYLGIGTAAHSFNGISRQYNESSLNKYIDGTYHITTEHLTPTDKYNEFIMLGLRMARGCNLSHLESTQRSYCLLQAQQYIVSNQLILDDNYLKINGSGWHLLDKITTDLMIAD